MAGRDPRFDATLHQRVLKLPGDLSCWAHLELAKAPRPTCCTTNWAPATFRRATFSGPPGVKAIVS